MKEANPIVTLEWAIQLAAKAHAKQVDKSGHPYILHPLRVMLAVSAEARIVAVLHDVLEDTTGYYNQLSAWLSDAGWVALDCLTRRKPEESYADYIQRVSTNKLATEIKRADIADNLDRIGNLPPEKQESLRIRYMKAAAVLSPGSVA